MKPILLFVYFLMIYTVSFSQSYKFPQAFQAAKQKAALMSLEKAEKYMVKFVKKYPHEGEAWDYLCKIQLYQWQNARSGSSITITTTDKEGNIIEGDSLSNTLRDLLTATSPKVIAKKKLIYNCRKALAYTNSAIYASVYLRKLNIELDVDTGVHEIAREYFQEGEEQFVKRNYVNAAEKYKLALNEDSNYFFAYLYLGDTYYAMEDYVTAIAYFKKAKERFPDLIEPRKYLADAYIKTEAYSAAFEEVKEALLIYPDLSLFYKLYDLAEDNGKTLKLGMEEKECVPAETGSDIANDKGGFRIKLHKNSPWNYYVTARNKGKEIADENGLFPEHSELAASRYLEVYAWEEMLKHCSEDQFPTARKFQKKNMLDCYVLFSNFHYDNYKQFVHLRDHHKEKLKNYYQYILE